LAIHILAEIAGLDREKLTVLLRGSLVIRSSVGAKWGKRKDRGKQSPRP